MLIATIAKRFTFDAAHRLENLPSDHKCNRLHGHTYTVELEFTGPVQGYGPEAGFVLDYQTIADAWAPLHAQLDHRYLNEVDGLMATSTTEWLAEWIIGRLAGQEVFQRAFVLRDRGRLDFVPLNYEQELERPMHQHHRATLLSAVRVEESSTTWCRVTTDAVRSHHGGTYPMSLISFL